MATTQESIRAWFLQGKQKEATHMIVVCDTLDYEDYPVYVSKDENVEAKAKTNHGTNMQKVMEVYDLRMDMEMQLNEFRAFHGVDASLFMK